jgi:hypothetical protein
MTGEPRIKYQYQTEGWLMRPLMSEELVEVASLEELSTAQLAVVHILACQHRLNCLNYLRGVVHDVLVNDALAFIDRIHDTQVRS